MIRHQHSAGRRGSVLPIFITCVILVAATGPVLVRTTLTQRDLVRADDMRVQADWLVHSAAARAASKLETDNSYEGEIWNLSASEVGQTNPAEISIKRVEPAANSASQKTHFEIRVTYPPTGDQRVRLTKTVTVGSDS